MHPALPMVDLEVIGAQKSAKIKALVDTAFSGYVSVPFSIAKDLGLVLCGEERFELANGQWLPQYKFRSAVKFLGATQEVEVVLTESATPLVGLLLLADCRVTIDFPSEKVSIVRKRK